MFSNFINDFNIEFVFPTDEEIDSLKTKLENKEELSFEDNFTLEKIRLLKLILNKELKNIKI